MPAVTVRNLSVETHRAIKVRAEQHGHSTEAEIRDILDQAVLPHERIKLGALLADVGRQAGLTEAEWTAFDQPRDPSSSEPLSFE